MKRILSTLLSCAVATLMAAAQPAYWITADDSLRNAPNTWMEFRKDFTLKKSPRKAEARIAADSKYWLWVNGTRTGLGYHQPELYTMCRPLSEQPHGGAAV